MRSVMKHDFARVAAVELPRSSFNRSHGYKTTFDAGYLIPVLVDEVLPGDTVNCRMHAFARVNTMLTPIMDNMFLDSFFFAVPYRLVWTNFHKFMGAQDDPGDSTDFTLPTMTAPGAGGVAENSLSDYFGIPTKVNSLEFVSLWHRAYNLCFNEWFRDENLQDSVVVDKDDGPDTYTDYVLLQRGKRHDYFTSCLPWAQKGTAVDIPLGTSAPIYRRDASNAYTHAYQKGGNSDALSANVQISSGRLTDGTNYITLAPYESGDSQWLANLSTATAATINSLREAFQLQRLYERDARGGTRYTEIIRSHFGVLSPDARLQRPEYLGGGSQPISVHPVAQTESSDASTPQGELTAFGTASVQGHGFTKSFTEHCLIIGLVSVRADLTYQQGLDRMFSRSTRWDLYWPSLAHIGEQAVLNKELYCDGSGNDDLTFGYQERYAEYRFKPSRITGQLRSNCTSSLDMWHVSQEFGSLPTLNTTFIKDTPPIDRVIATPGEPHMMFDSYFDYLHVRPMPVRGIPGLIDHF